MGPVTKGLLAGAAGTVVLNLVGYGDMLLRGRSSSDVPAEVADRLAGRTGVALGDGEARSSREQAVGALLGTSSVSGSAVRTGCGAAGPARRRSGPPGRCSARPPWRAATSRPPC
ncbi:hypothetical protein [Streptomyces sp. NPDC002573]|uniref:hypothetical protein n=1 Tax=Streptomyces sp. NPDC002573 TaxID=3364651 RepID=UPI0036BA886C